MRTSAGLKILLRLFAIFMMASFSFAKPHLDKPHINIEYYISDGEVFRSFEKSGLSIYAYMPVVREVDVDALDEIPLFGVVDDNGINAMDLDSVFVQTATQTLFYDCTKQRAGYFFQDYVQNIKEDATIQLFFSATLGKAVLKNVVVSNEGPVPIVLKTQTGENELLQGESDAVAFVTKLRVTPKVHPGERLDSLYMFFSVELDEEASANASPSTLDALDSLRFMMRVRSDMVDLERVLKNALKILDADSSVNFSSVQFKVEFFATTHKHLHSFVFTKDLDSTFYDETWKEEVSMADGGGDFPTVYRADACFDGWSVENRDIEGRMFKSSDFDMSLLNSEDEVLVMKPNWTYGPECAGLDVTLGSDHGSIELLQVVSGDTVFRSLRDSIRVPRSMNGLPFIVHALPDSAFVVDGMIPYTVLSDVSSKRKTRKKHSSLVADSGWVRIGGTTQFEPHFVPGSDPEPLMVIVESGLEVSGNAARLRYSTGEMNIFRKVGFRVTVTGPEGYIVDSLLVDSAETTMLEGEWRLVPAPVGEYVVEAKVFHDLDSASYVDTLRVAGEMAIDAGAWAMVSLSGVDMQSLKWDDDQLFYRWDESYGGAEYMQYRRLKRGDEPSAVDGFWYNSLEGRSLSIVGENAGELAFSWTLDSLNSGWNLMANPHGYYVDLRAAAAGDSVQFWRWNPKTREYEMPTVLGPYEAVWAKVDRTVVWELDGEPVFDSSLWEGSALARRALAKEGAGDGWEFRVVLSDGRGHRDSWNILGASTRDVSREEPPSAMGDHVNLSVLGDRGGRLAKSLRRFTKDGAYEWTLELQAGSESDAFVSAEGVAALQARGLRVFLTIDGKTTELSDGDSLGVRLLPRAREATLRVASAPKVKVSYTLDGLKFRQSPGVLQVGFVAGKGLAGNSAKVELLDLQGRVVSSAAFSARDGANSAALRVTRSGIFVARVSVGGHRLVSRVAVR